MNKKVLVVAAHPDDEVLGCGGTIARHVAAGQDVSIVFLSDGVSSREINQNSQIAIEERRNAAANAHAVLGVGSATYFNFPDNMMDSIPLLDIVKPLEELIHRLKPEIVYTHHSGDLNIDHRVTHEAVLTACRPIPGHTVREIYAFEVMSSTEWGALSLPPFTPNVYVDITGQLAEKLRALQAYELEMRPSPYSRSMRHLECLAEHRGHSVGVGAAEAFFMVRMLL